MFTGIIEHMGTIESLKANAEGGRLTIHAPAVAKQLAVSNSVAVNGCCLTVVELDDARFRLIFRERRCGRHRSASGKPARG